MSLNIVRKKDKNKNKFFKASHLIFSRAKKRNAVYCMGEGEGYQGEGYFFLIVVYNIYNFFLPVLINAGFFYL
jgi:hypothetical protein